MAEIGKYIGSCLHNRSYLLWSPVIVRGIGVPMNSPYFCMYGSSEWASVMLLCLEYKVESPVITWVQALG